MTERKADLVRWRDVRESFGLLTRLPVGGTHARGAAAAWAWPLAGLAVAVVSAGIGVAGMAVGLPAGFAAGLTLAGLVVLTGGLHEDGLADSADGFWGGAAAARRLEIMKDSRTGAYGVIALILGLGLRWSAIATLLDAGSLVPGLVAAAMLSRTAMAGLMAALPSARAGGLSAATGRPEARTALLAAAVGAVGAVLALGIAALGAVLLVLGVAAFWGVIARAKVGGQTGDVLGAGQQLTEIAVLGFAAALA